MHDHISDMLIRLKNGQKAGLFEVELYNSIPKICVEILNILYKEGYIRGFKKINQKNIIKYIVLLKYDLSGNGVINKIERISKPSKRVYISSNILWKVNKGTGIFIISSKKGLLTDMEARILNLGGELLCNIQ